MEFKVSSSPAYSMVTATLSIGETINIEKGSLAWASDGLQVKGRIHKGVIKSYLRKKITDETFFMIECKALVEGAWVSFAPRFPGDIKPTAVFPGTDLFVESGSLLGFSSNIDLKVGWAGLANIALHEGAGILRVAVRGDEPGTVVLCGFGGLETQELPSRETGTIIDTGHLVAWTSACTIQAGAFEGILQADLTGEGMVAKVSGPGKVLLQTRAPKRMSSWIFGDLGPGTV
jgi:uncharacterized protein (TIGR00266 family)